MSSTEKISKKKLNTRLIRTNKVKNGHPYLRMLTCYDFQTAQLLNSLPLDMILVGDSLGNVILGYDTTISVTLEEMIIFCKAVKRGSPQTFVIGDMPFGTYQNLEEGVKNCSRLFQESLVEAVKIEGATPLKLSIIERLGEVGVPVIGHIGLTPQSIHHQGIYRTHGKEEAEAQILIDEALKLEAAGAFAIVLECVHPEVAQKITELLSIPTIGIGSGTATDGDVLVINDLFHMGPKTPPKFCIPIANDYLRKQELLRDYLKNKPSSLEIAKAPASFENNVEDIPAIYS